MKELGFQQIHYFSRNFPQLYQTTFAPLSWFGANFCCFQTLPPIIRSPTALRKYHTDWRPFFFVFRHYLQERQPQSLYSLYPWRKTHNYSGFYYWNLLVGWWGAALTPTLNCSNWMTTWSQPVHCYCSRFVFISLWLGALLLCLHCFYCHWQVFCLSFRCDLERAPKFTVKTYIYMCTYLYLVDDSLRWSRNGFKFQILLLKGLWVYQYGCCFLVWTMYN